MTLNRALRIGLVYLTASVLWIVFSDAVVASLDLSPSAAVGVQTAKGLIFVVFSAALVTVLAWRELARSQEVERYFEASPDLFAILDHEGQVLRLNGKWPEIPGAGSGEVQGGWLQQRVHPEDREAVAGVLERVKAGEPVQDFTCRFRRADGEWRGFDWRLTPFGQQIHAAGRDITDREALREELIRSEERYQKVFEASPLPTWIFDRKSLAFLAVNDAATARYGWSREEFLGMTLADIRPAGEMPRLLRAVEETPAGRFHQAGIFQHRTRDGAIMEVEVNSHRISFKGRDAELVVASDVTARVQAEDQLRQAQRMESVGRLAGGVAHDFNNILTIISNLTELTLEGLPPDSPARELLADVLAAQHRGATLTRQLLTFSRQEPADGAESVNLTRALEGMTGMLRPLMGGGIRIHLSLPEAPVVVIIPPVRLEQVIMNLAVNARDAMPRGGEFHIELMAEPSAEGGKGEAVITVRDTGSGIPRDVMGRIFDPFFTTKPPNQGTGLGLSTAYSIVTGAGGSLTAESEPGKGASFQVRLPLATHDGEEPAADSEEAPSSADPEARPDTVRILLVEDEVPLQRALKLGLGRRGYEVDTASDGVEALDFMKGKAVDLLITDMVMPGMDGRTLIQTLRKEHPSLPVLVISGYAGDSPDVRAFLAREHFLAKPFTLDKLAETLRGILAREG